MSYSARNYRHRNPRGKDEKKGQTPFFNAQKSVVARKKKKGKELTSIQRLATSKEDEKLGTNDARMEKDKEDPMKPVQKKDAPKDGKKEEEKPVQKADKGKKGKGKEKDKEEKPVQKKDKPKKGEKDKEEKPVQKKEAPKKGKKEEEKPVQKKEEKKTSSHVAEEIKKQSGKGRPLPPPVLAEMGKSFGVDLSHVSIHNDAAAAKLCKELHAMAFTHGQDIFFDEGKYNPESPEGKKLLAHELAHVVQQTNTDN